MPEVEDQISDSDGSELRTTERAADGLDGLGGRASSGALWTMVGLGSGQIIRLISNIILPDATSVRPTESTAPCLNASGIFSRRQPRSDLFNPATR
jgi:hypothetical protein